MSDVDILVELNQPIGFAFFDLAKKLETHLQISVDLVSRNVIKPAYFAAIEPDLIYVCAFVSVFTAQATLQQLGR